MTYLLLLALLHKCLFALLALTLLFPCEVALSRHLLHRLAVQALQVDLSGSGNDIFCVYSSDGDAVDFEWAGYEESAL